MKKTAIVTGASRGIGRAVARQLARDGFDVVACFCNSENDAKSLLEEIGGFSRAIAVRANVADEQDVQNLLNQTLKTFGKVDVLVNCAGVSDTRLLIDSTKSDYDHVFDVNMRGTYNTCKIIGREMLSSQSGKIVNISSVWGIVGGSCESVYSASKGAIIAFTKALAKEFGPNGINVNCVAPGFVETDMTKNVAEDIREEIKENSALNRLGAPEDIAGVVSFLASEKSNFVTGQVITADGGWQI